MIKISNHILMGLEFDDEELYKQSKRELENIMKVKKNYNIKNKSSLLEFYNKLIEERIFKTPVGIEYLRDIQKELYSAKEINHEEIKAIPAFVYANPANGEDGNAKSMASQSAATAKQPSQRKYNEKYRDLYIKMLIVNVVLLLTICTMFIITKHSKKYDLDYYRESIENDYLDWENNLREREEAINTNHNFNEK